MPNENDPEATSHVNLLFAGELFAQAPVEQYPGSVVEAVTDSSRYFVIKIEDGNGKTLSSEAGTIFHIWPDTEFVTQILYSG